MKQLGITKMVTEASPEYSPECWKKNIPLIKWFLGGSPLKSMAQKRKRDKPIVSIAVAHSSPVLLDISNPN